MSWFATVKTDDTVAIREMLVDWKAPFKVFWESVTVCKFRQQGVTNGPLQIMFKGLWNQSK